MLDRSRFERRGFLLGLIGLLSVMGSWLVPRDARGDETKDRISYSIAHVSPAGTYVYVAGKWGIVRINVTNPTSEPVEVLAASYFEDEPTLQYGRRIWIPANSRLQTWHSVLLPPKSSRGPDRFDFRTLVMDVAQKREVLIRSDSGALQFDGTLRAHEGKLITGLIGRLGVSEAPDGTAPFDLVLSSQLFSIRNGQLTNLSDRLLPAGEECLQTLDQLVIADSRVNNDGVGLVAIRRWLFGGGTLWVMLDQADPLVLERLLGDESLCQVVDRVGLTTVRLEMKSPNGNIASETRDHERPVELVRVLASGVEVVCTIDGWPAAFWKTCGEGRLLVTTMAPNGWMRARTAEDNMNVRRFGPSTSPGNPRPTPTDGQAEQVAPNSSSESGAAPRQGQGFTPPRPPTGTESRQGPWQAKFIPSEMMRTIASDFFRPRPEPRLAKVNSEELVQAYVGYSIPARWQVIGLLLGFSGLVAATGFWMWRRSRLELLGVISPALALVVSGVLVWLGWQQRKSIPAAVASMQFVRAVPGTDDVRVEGFAGLFSPDSGVVTAGSNRGGWLMPDMTGLEGTTRRMVWSDLDEWKWENLPESAGLMHATLQQSTTAPERLEARATFGPEGLTGRLHAPAAHQPTDAMLATRDGRIGVELRDDGTFVARSSAVFTAEQFFAADLLSDEQHRRQQTLRQLLDDPQRRDFPAEPQLMFWSKPWNLGFQFAQNRQTLGSALVAVPLKFERPPTGTEVSLAAPLLPYREALGPDDIGSTGLWDYRKREWQQKSVPTMTWLKFQIPGALLPVAVQSGRLVIRVAGPVVRLEIAGLRPNRQDVVPIKTWTDPVGTLSLELTDAELLSVAADGGLMLRVSGGDPKRVESTSSTTDLDAKVSYWRIESLALDLRVKTTEAN